MLLNGYKTSLDTLYYNSTYKQLLENWIYNANIIFVFPRARSKSSMLGFLTAC